MSEKNDDALKQLLANHRQLIASSAEVNQKCSAFIVAADIIQQALVVNKQFQEHSGMLLNELEKRQQSADQNGGAV